MKKHTYRAQKVNNINWQQVKEKTIGETSVLAVDVAKVQQFALLTNQEHTQTWLMQWSHLEHTQYLTEQLKALDVPITVVMESTSTYGDSLRYQEDQWRSMGSWDQWGQTRLIMAAFQVPARRRSASFSETRNFQSHIPKQLKKGSVKGPSTAVKQTG